MHQQLTTTKQSQQYSRIELFLLFSLIIFQFCQQHHVMAFENSSSGAKKFITSSSSYEISSSSSSLSVDQQDHHNGDHSVIVYQYETYYNFISITNRNSFTTNLNQLQEQQQLNNATTNSTTTNYGSCNPILFQLGDFSRDGPNLLYGICPETWLSPAVSIIFMVAYIIVMIVSGIGLYWQRASPHIKARNITYMFMTILSNSGFIILTCSRFIIGRRIYPCSLYILTFFIVPPGILLPSVFRLWRLFFMHKLNSQKTNEIITTAKKGKEIAEPNVSPPQPPQLPPQLPQLPQLPQQSQTIDNNIKSPCCDNNTTVDAQSVFGFDDGQESVMVSDDNTSYWVVGVVEEMEDNQKFSKLQKFYNLALSQKFVLATYIISFIAHIFIFIFFGAIEEGIYSSSGQNDPSTTRVFMGEGGFFVSTRGCMVTTAITIILAIEATFYIIVQGILLVLCFIIPRDTWYIKRESLLLTLLQFLTIIIFAVCSFVPHVSRLTDFFVPFGFSLMTYSFVEVVICVLLPIVYSVMLKRKKKDVKGSELHQFLKNKKTFNILLDFARRSYCPEPVLCFEDIERFKLTSKKNRKRAAIHITNTYLKPNSPLELNFPNLDTVYEQLLKQIEETQILDAAFFNTVQWHCLDDMTDVFERLKTQSKETKQILQEWRDAAASMNNLQPPPQLQRPRTVVLTDRPSVFELESPPTQLSSSLPNSKQLTNVVDNEKAMTQAYNLGYL